MKYYCQKDKLNKELFQNPNITGLQTLAKVDAFLKFGHFPPAPGKL